MGPRLDRLRNNEQTYQTTHEQAVDNRINFCLRELPTLTAKVVEAINKKKNVEEDYVPVHFNDMTGGANEYAAWSLLTWPAYGLPGDVQSYEVLMLEDGRLVSRSTDWSNVVTMDNYDPFRHQSPALNVVSVYSALASLPRDYFFREEHMGRLPQS